MTGFDSTSAQANHYAIALLLARWLSRPAFALAKVVGLSRFELLTPRLSSVCSNQLSYRPSRASRPCQRTVAGSFKTEQDVRALAVDSLRPRLSPGLMVYQIDLSWSASGSHSGFEIIPSLRPSARPVSRKEVIQPQVLLQLPCYDFTPITNHTLGACLPCGLAQRLLVQPAFVM